MEKSHRSTLSRFGDSTEIYFFFFCLRVSLEMKDWDPEISLPRWVAGNYTRGFRFPNPSQ